MLRTTSRQASLWDALLPAEVLGVPAELARVDRLLDDPVFIQPFRAHFDPVAGRPLIPIDTYLRLMFLKFRYRLGYELLLARAVEHKLLRTHKLRADTTVVAANVAYPTDLGLFEVTGQVTRLAEAQLADARRVLVGARRALTRDRTQPAGRLQAVVEELQTTIQRTRRLLDQAHTRLGRGDAGWGQPADQPERPRCPADPQGPPRPAGRVRLQGPGPRQPRRHRTRPHRHGRQSTGCALLASAIERVIAQTGRLPGAVTADRGYGEAAVEQELADLGVARVAIPRRSRAGPARQAVEHWRGFRRLVKWRTGCEGRISQLKHHFGWDRARMDGIDGARIWCGHGVFAHNLVKLGGLLDGRHHKAA